MRLAHPARVRKSSGRASAWSGVREPHFDGEARVHLSGSAPLGEIGGIELSPVTSREDATQCVAVIGPPLPCRRRALGDYRVGSATSELAHIVAARKTAATVESEHSRSRMVGSAREPRRPRLLRTKTANSTRRRRQLCFTRLRTRPLGRGAVPVLYFAYLLSSRYIQSVWYAYMGVPSEPSSEKDPCPPALDDPQIHPRPEYDADGLDAYGYNVEGYNAYGERRPLSPDESRLLNFYRHFGRAQPGDADALQAVLDTADDERPLQRFLQERPHLLATAFLSGGHGHYVRPQVRLGSQWVVDFLIADASSQGTFWRLVELESPTAKIFLQSGEFAKEARHAQYQIQTWRQWLKENLDYARKPPPSGLGLVDIEPRAEGIILIGRRVDLDEGTNWLRRKLRLEERIHLMTYDNLLHIIRASEAR
jgi:hypothetical protein